MVALSASRVSVRSTGISDSCRQNHKGDLWMSVADRLYDEESIETIPLFCRNPLIFLLSNGNNSHKGVFPIH